MRRCSPSCMQARDPNSLSASSGDYLVQGGRVTPQQTNAWITIRLLVLAAIVPVVLTACKDRLEHYAEIKNRCDRLNHTGQFEQALACYLNAVTVNDLDPKLHFDLGEVYERLGKAEQAIQQFERVRQMNPTFVENRYDLGMEYFLKGRYGVALEEIKEVLRLQPDHLPALELLASTYEMTGNFQKAIETLLTVSERVPKHLWAHAHLGALYREQFKYAEAKQAFHRAVEVNPLDANAFCQLGELELQAGSTAALAYFKKAVELAPLAPGYHLRLAAALYQTGDFQSALESIEKCLELSPAFSSAKEYKKAIEEKLRQLHATKVQGGETPMPKPDRSP